MILLKIEGEKREDLRMRVLSQKWKNIYTDPWLGKYYCILGRFQANKDIGWQAWINLILLITGKFGEEGVPRKTYTLI